MSDFENGTPSEGGKGLAIASMVLGIVSIVLSCTWIGVIAGIVGLVLAIVYNKNNEKCGMSQAGLICSIIGIILFIVIIILGVVLGLAVGTAALSELAM